MRFLIEIKRRLYKILPEPAPAVKNAGGLGAELLDGERFLYVCVGSDVQALHFGLDVGLGRQQDDRDMRERGIAADGPTQLDAVHVGHHYVGDDDVYVPVFKNGERFDTVRRREGIESIREIVGDERTQLVVVLHYQHRGHVAVLRAGCGVGIRGSVFISRLCAGCPVMLLSVGLQRRGDCQDEPAAVAVFGLDADLAVVHPGETSGQRKAKSGAGMFAMVVHLIE